MVARMEWFSRTFSFDLPAWMFPNIIERLRGTPARIENRIATFSPEVLTRRDGARWSIQENVGHLLDLEPLWLGRIEDFDAGRETLRPADLTNKKTHEAGHNAASIDDVTGAFRSIRREMVGRLEKYGEEQFLRTALHPRLETPMRVLDLAFFVAEHDDHHLAQITELLRTFEA
ncbi:MAG: DinB family protein [Candidatus Krumholzibacteriia bacterium]